MGRTRPHDARQPFQCGSAPFRGTGARGLARLAPLFLLVALLPDSGWAEEVAAGEGPRRALLAPATVEGLLTRSIETVAEGARESLAGRTLHYLSEAEAIARALEGNPAIHREAARLEAARAGETQREALFDPTVNLFLNYSRSKSFDRITTIPRWREAPDIFDTIVEGDYVEGHGIVLATDTQLIGKSRAELGLDDNTCVYFGGTELGETCSNTPYFAAETEYASGLSSHWTKTWSGGVGVRGLTRWGGDFGLQLQTDYHPYDYNKSAAVDILSTAIQLGYHEWVSNASLDFQTPVPFAQDFGSDGFGPEVERRAAELTRRRTSLAGETAAEAIAQAALEAYWELVGALLGAESAATNRVVMAKNLERMRLMFQEGRLTRHGLTQARFELASAREMEELAWLAFVRKGNRLAEMLGLEPERVPVPRDFLVDLDQAPTAPAENEPEALLASHPRIQTRATDVEISDLRQAQSENRLLPDLDFIVSLDVAQSNAVFGYESLWESWEELTSPDTLNSYIGFRLTFPLGDRADHAANVRARAERDRSLDMLQAERLEVSRGLAQGRADWESAMAQATLAEENFDLVQQTIEGADLLWSLGRLSDFERLRRYRELFEARNGFIQTLVKRRVAWVRLLAAQGRLRASLAAEASRSASSASFAFPSRQTFSAVAVTPPPRTSVMGRSGAIHPANAPPVSPARPIHPAADVGHPTTAPVPPLSSFGPPPRRRGEATGFSAQAEPPGPPPPFHSGDAS